MDLSQSRLDVNEYNEEKIEDSLMSVILSCVNIIVNPAGFLPELPHIGVGIANKLHFLVDNTDEVTTMQAMAEQQIGEVFPSLGIIPIFSIIQDPIRKDFYTHITLSIPDLRTTIAVRYKSLAEMDITRTTYKQKNFNIS